MKQHILTRLLLSCLLAGVLVTTGNANIWIDEGFEDGQAFDATARDTYSIDPPPLNPPLAAPTATGTVVNNAGAFAGTNCYRLEAGQEISIPPHPNIATNSFSYHKPTNGNFQYWQFALRPESIPAAGEVARFEWKFRVGDPLTDYTFFLKLDSTGTSITVTAGEDEALNISQQLGYYSDLNDWVFYTLQFQKNSAPSDDLNDTSPVQTGRPDMQDVPQGMRFYVSSSTQAYTIELPGTSTFGGDISKEWKFSASSGSVLIDEMYWEGGMDGDEGASDNLRPFAQGQPLDTGAPPEPTGARRGWSSLE